MTGSGTRLSAARIAAGQFRKKPVVIEAFPWNGDNIDDAMAFIRSDDRWKEGVDDGGYVGGPGIGHAPPLGTLDIPTLEGTMTANPGDWIIRGVKGELYPCKPDIFDATYDAADVVEASEVARLRTALTEAEWVEVFPEARVGDFICGGCGNERSHGHDDGCSVAEALAGTPDDADKLDVFMLGVLMRQWYEEHDERRPEYLFALDWVVEAWRSADDPVRTKLTAYAAACSEAMDAADEKTRALAESVPSPPQDQK